MDWPFNSEISLVIGIFSIDFVPHPKPFSSLKGWSSDESWVSYFLLAKSDVEFLASSWHARSHQTDSGPCGQNQSRGIKASIHVYCPCEPTSVPPARRLRLVAFLELSRAVTPNDTFLIFKGTALLSALQSLSFCRPESFTNHPAEA